MLKIRRANLADASQVFAHFKRHSAESGNGDIIFKPMTGNELSGEVSYLKKVEKIWSLSTSALGWEAFWILESATKETLGHISLHSLGMEASKHRAMLAMGIERKARGQGFGRQLALAAINWAKTEPGLNWIDLRVFAHNEAARTLYQSLHFVETGIVQDLFRVSGQSIDDIRMCLRLTP